MSIPIFGDVTMVLTAPIVAYISKRKNISTSTMGTWTAIGSMGMTTAAIILPMMEVLGLTPMLTTFLIGSGVMVGSHVNNSGFWVAAQMFNFNTTQAFKYVTFAWSILGVFSFIFIVIFHTIGIF
jgi:GntP family gluconate:H+ symporter